MYYEGILVGLGSFLIIGLFHPVIIKGEYYFGARIWPVFPLFGAGFLGWSLATANPTVSALLGVLGFTCFWSILELFEQEKRVAKGWFPANPKRRRPGTAADGRDFSGHSSDF